MVVTWALKKTAYYTLGLEKLLLLVDHKPLLGLLKSRNFAPDALSRYWASPSPEGQSIKVSEEFLSEHVKDQPDSVVHFNSLNSVPELDQILSDKL